MAKPVLRSGYTFAPASKQISFAGVPGFNINGLLAIFNRTAGVMIFDATEPTLDFASVSGSTVTLKYDTTSGMVAGDVLTVIYDEQAQDGLINVYSLTSTIAQVGVPTAGYGTIMLVLSGAFSGTVGLEFSDDSTDGIDGTWLSLPGDSATSIGANPTTSFSTANTRAYYPAIYGAWVRVKAGSYSSGTIVARLIRRLSPIFSRAVVLAGGLALSAGNSTIGGVFPVVNTGSAGASAARIKSAASTNSTLVITAARNLYGGLVSNAGTAAAFLKLYDKATAPTVGTDTPVLTIMIPAGSTLNLERTIPRRFSTGLAYAITGGKADNDTTAVAADDIQGELIYA